jgi:hypothetical protein
MIFIIIFIIEKKEDPILQLKEKRSKERYGRIIEDN